MDPGPALAVRMVLNGHVFGSPPIARVWIYSGHPYNWKREEAFKNSQR